MEALFKSIRAATSPLLWSRGVELSRGGGVVGESLTDTEVVLRVASPERAVSATVRLWPEDEDWLCDCQSKQNPCEHVVAGVIALRRAKEQGKPLPTSTVARGIVTYHFTRTEGALALERNIRVGDAETLLESGLAALIAGRVSGPSVNASKEDLTADSLLGYSGRGVIAERTLIELFTILKQSGQVSLDGLKISVAAPVSGWKAVVVDVPNGVRVSLELDSTITERFSNGACIFEGALCALVEPEWNAVERDMKSRGKMFPRNELGELATSLLPALAKKLKVENRSENLPQVGEAVRPRLIFQTSASGDLLSVLPLIVYGDPAYARVDGGKLTLLGEGTTIPERNKIAESSLAHSLHAEFGLSVGKRIEFRGEAATKFSEKLRSQGRAVVGNGIGYFGLKPPLLPALEFDGERVRVEFRAPGGGTADGRAVFQAWQEGLNRVSLFGGEGWAPIPKDWLDRYGHRVLALLEARSSEGTFPVYARPELARLCEELNAPCPPEFRQLKESLANFSQIPSASLASDLAAELRPYQKQGVDWLTFLNRNRLGALLADDMGLGKTLQAIAVFAGRVLVVAPTSVLPNWQNEIARFRPKLKVSIYHGSHRELDSSADVTLTTYAILRLDIERLSDISWDMAVLDEAQNIKNPESQVAEAAFRLQSRFRVALSGTPVENRLEDLWSLFHFLNPGLLGGRSGFREQYSMTQLQKSQSAISDLRAKTKPFILRRLKREVAKDLPPRTDLVVYCDLEPNERVTYEAVKAAARGEALEALSHSGNVLAALECLLRLRQAACHSGLLPGQLAEDSSKVRVLKEKLEELSAEGHKALVFSQWTSLLDLIEPHLQKAGLGYCRIDGSTRDRAEVVTRFQDEKGPPVLLMTLKAGGVGLNLTAADYVFLMDPWWNPAAEDQAADRAHRIGQDRPVFVHRLVARDTVEEKILQLQETKRAAAAMALEGTAGTLGITRDDLMALLA